MEGGSGRHGFTVELGSKQHFRRLMLLNESREGVLFEGTLGELVSVTMVEGVMLEILGSNGTIRVEVTEEELRQGISLNKQNKSE